MPAIMLPHGCEGLRVRRRTVLWTFRRPFMGRPVPRQLLRNALLDLTTIVPATACHRRSYAERYSRYIHKSHISDVHRLSRLLIAACLAYIWIVYLGSVCEKDRWRPIIHRRKRCDLSLFQLGLRLLEYFLNEDLPIPVQFHVTI